MWPMWFQQELTAWFEKENQNLPLKPIVSLPQHSSVILLPIYLAMKNVGLTSFVLEDKSNSLTNHKIRQLRDFDQSWFISIFEITISYLLIHRLINMQRYSDLLEQACQRTKESTLSVLGISDPELREHLAEQMSQLPGGKFHFLLPLFLSTLLLGSRHR